MSRASNVTWVEAALVEPGMRQLSLNPPEREITDVVDAGGAGVVVAYDDGSTRAYAQHQDLPILTAEPKGPNR